MPVDDSSVVDLIGISQDDGSVVLTVSDHLDWSEVETHVSILEDKLNKYIAFVESGELLTSYPKARGRSVRFEIVFRLPPPARAVEFLSQAAGVLEDASVCLEWRLLDKVPAN